MVFANLIFLYLFLPLNMILYYISKNIIYRNIVLIIFSLFFYAWGEPVWVVLLLFSAFIDYFNARVVEKYRGRLGAKLGVVASLVVNLGVLATFKYSGFLVENLNALSGVQLQVPSFALPIGISFYTFQTISYVLDVYRGEPAQKSFFKVLLFVSLYPQLVAGPIVRYSHIAWEIDNRKADFADMSRGITRFCIGLCKKVVIANTAGNFVAQYLDGDLSSLSVGGAWFGLLMFSIQIYYDFSGYSDMAIGLGWLFGFHYYENFNYPYIATSATDFWRRWHISLGSFFRDYVYIPMGGNRKHQGLNLFVVWFLTGLWHGASWNFILWGLYFGLLIYLEKLFFHKVLQKIPKAFSHLYLLVAAVLGWAMFYFTDLSRLGDFFRVLFGLSGQAAWDSQLSILLMNNLFWLIIAALFCMPVLPLLKKKLEHKAGDTAQTAFVYGESFLNVALIVLCTTLLVGESFNPFLYFRF